MRIHFQRVLATTALFAMLPLCGQVVSTGKNPTQPYTAEIQTTTTRTLADGTTITLTSREIHVRDSQGRSRLETTIPLRSSMPAITNVAISDPVGGTRINWNSQTRVAWIIKLPPADQKTGCWTTVDSPHHVTLSYGDAHPDTANVNAGSVPGGVGSGGLSTTAASTDVTTPATLRHHRPDAKLEDLGTDMIMGVAAHGHRTTTTLPIGEVGNDRPIVTVDEQWEAPDLRLVMRALNDDPRTGKRDMEVTSLSLSEPDPSVFQAPPDMKVRVEEMHQYPCGEQPF
jgi:hypothetical protein